MLPAKGRFWLTLLLIAGGIVLAVPAWAGAEEFDRAVALVERGEKSLDLPTLEKAIAILAKECQGPHRDGRCEYYLSRAYLAAYTYWAKQQGGDPLKAADFLTRARDAGEEAAVRRPNDASVQVLLGKIYQILLVRNYIAGITQATVSVSPVYDHFTRALEIEPENGEAQMGLGIYFLTIPRFLGGDAHRARQYFNRAAKFMPDNPEPLVWISRSYREQGRLEKARIYLNQALALYPDSYSVLMEDARLREAEKAAGQ